VILGDVQIGHHSSSDSIFKHILTCGSYGYDIRLEMGELLGQAELRAEHKGSASTTLTKFAQPVPTAAVTKKSNGKVAWAAENKLTTVAPVATATSTQLSSNLLAEHSSDIRKLFETVASLNEKVDRQAASFITLDQIRALFREEVRGPDKA
jgi:hypothetical protein